MCNTTQEEALLSSTTLLYLKKIQKCFLFTLTVVLTEKLHESSRKWKFYLVATVPFEASQLKC